mmetsp:Transcript_25127/g.59288  ORF Transcript_25127/g.59288 Transcript_25127/m.59288 type:complete len:234 (+) Transcript_25127:2188-2889(+)
MPFPYFVQGNFHFSAALYSMLRIHTKKLRSGRNRQGFQIEAEHTRYRATLATRHQVHHAEIRKITEGIANRAKLPIEDGNYFWFRWMKNQIVDFEISVQQRDSIGTISRVFLELTGEVFDLRCGSPRKFCLPSTHSLQTIELPLYILSPLPVISKAYRSNVHVVQIRHDGHYTLVSTFSLYFCHPGHRRVCVDSTRYKLHQIKFGSDDRFILAVGIRIRDRDLFVSILLIVFL